MVVAYCAPVASALMIIASDQRRGAETFAVALSAALESAGHRSTTMAIRGYGGSSAIRVPVAGRSRWDPAGLVRLVAAARRHDVVVGHGSSALLGGYAVAALARRPFIYRNIGDPTTWGARRGADLRIGAPLRRAAAVAALYGEAGRELCLRYRLDPSRVRTIPNGASTERFEVTTPDARSAARERFGLQPGKSWLGCIGALSEEKRVGLAIELVGRDVDLGLVVAGDGPERDALARRANKVAPDRVLFLGSVDDIGPVYDALDVLYLPSRTEGLPAVAIEAALSGLPVVASPVGGLAEVVVDGHTGRLVDPTDLDAARAAVAEAIARRREFGASARGHVERLYSMDHVAREWGSLLDDIVSRRDGGRTRRGS